jgi:hypothetical protein
VTLNLPDRFTLGFPSRHFLLQAGNLASGVAPAEYPFQPASGDGFPCYSSSVGQRSAFERSFPRRRPVAQATRNEKALVSLASSQGPAVFEELPDRASALDCRFEIKLFIGKAHHSRDPPAGNSKEKQDCRDADSRVQKEAQTVNVMESIFQLAADAAEVGIRRLKHLSQARDSRANHEPKAIVREGPLWAVENQATAGKGLPSDSVSPFNWLASETDGATA